MAYYQDAPGKRPQKRNYADDGNWEDEGSRYNRPAARRFGPEGGAPRDDRARRGGYRDGHASYAPPTRGDFRRGNDRQREDRPYNDHGRDNRLPRREYPERSNGFRRDDRPRTARPVERRPRQETAPRPAYPARPVPPPAPQASYLDHEYRPMTQPQAEPMERENLLVGRNPIREALKSGRDIEKLLVQRGELSGSAREIVQTARAAHIIVQEVDKVRLDELAPHHQGMIAFASAYQYATVDAMLEEARAKEEPPFLILLDGVTDPHNLGAIIRSAECVGAHGVIVPERRSVGLTPAAVKASAGAIEHMKVARVTNLNRTMEELKKQGIWTYAVTMDGEDYETVDFKGGVALVIGAEGEGISRLTLEGCDQRVSLPMEGCIDSLNASVAAGVMMYRVLSSRRKA